MLKRNTEILTLYFAQPCLSKAGPFAEIKTVESYKGKRLSMSKGNINLTDYWYTMLDTFLEQDMSYTCQYIDLLSDEVSGEPGKAKANWWMTEYEEGRTWFCLSFIKLNLENAQYKDSENMLREKIDHGKFFRTFGNADFIFAFSAENGEELESHLACVKQINEDTKDETGKGIFFSNYYLYGESKLTENSRFIISQYKIDDGGGCQKHILYENGWCGEAMTRIRSRIEDSRAKKNKKMVAYYQGLGQIINIIMQYEQETLYKDLFYMFYPPISLFMKLLEQAEADLKACREREQNEKLDIKLRNEAKNERYRKARRLELSISGFIDSMEVLLHHMGHSCRDILSDSGRGGIPYDIPIRLCLMYTAYLHALTSILNDEKEQYCFEYCLAPLAYSRPQTECLDLGLSPGSRLIRILISKQMMFMPRTLLIVLAHEISHYVSCRPRSRKLRAKCFAEIANLAMVECLIPSDLLHRLDIEESGEMREYLEDLRIRVYNYLSDTVWLQKWEDSDENSREFYFAEFFENLNKRCRRLLEGDDLTIKWNLETVNVDFIKRLRQAEGSRDSFKDILIIQEHIKAQRMILWDKQSLHSFLESVAENLREVYADISAILLLDLSPDEFLESYVLSEGFLPDEDVISSVLLNRIAMVKLVLQREKKSWKTWITKEERRAASDRKESKRDLKNFLFELKVRVDRYIQLYSGKTAVSGTGVKAAPNTGEVCASNDLFYYKDVLKYEEQYFSECLDRILSQLNEDELAGHQEMLKNLFRHFRVCEKNGETLYQEFFEDYGKLIEWFKKSVDSKMKKLN